MSSNRPERHLVHRAQVHDDITPAPRSSHRPRASETLLREREREPAALPPYELPSYPLTEDAKRKIQNLQSNRDYAGYKKHIAKAMKNVKDAAVESNDRLAKRQDEFEKIMRRHKRQEDGEKPDLKNAEMMLKNLEKKVEPIATETEKALRDLIDYGDELAMQDEILKDVTNRIPAAPAPRRSRVAGEENEDRDEEPPVEEGEIVSALELLQKAKQDYKDKYASKPMRARYAENNDYKDFKRTVYDAQHQGDAPPLPNAKNWFNEETREPILTRRKANEADNANNGSDSDEDVVIARASNVVKCPLTLQYFIEPYSNDVCSHTFEKFAIVEQIQNGTMGERKNKAGKVVREKLVQCPQTGCDAMFGLSNFHLDELVMRQVKREKEKAEREGGDDSSDDEDEDQEPRGTQKKPQAIDEEDDEMDNSDEDNKRRKKILKVKKEHSMSRAPSRRLESSMPDDNDITMIDD